MSADIISIIVLCVCVVLFITELIPMVTTAVLGATAMVVLEVCTFTEGYGGFASEPVMMIIGVIILGNSLFDTGGAQLIGKNIIKVAGSNERAILFVAMLLVAIISAFLSNTAVVAMFIAISRGLTASNPDIKMKNLLMPISYAAVAGGCLTLVGSIPQVVAQGILIDQLGEGFGFFDFAYIGVPIVISMIAYYVFIGYPMGKKIWGNRDDDGIQTTSTSSKEILTQEVNMAKLCVVLGIFMLTVIGFITGIFGVGTTAMLAGLACILTGCISQKRALETMDWVSVGVIGGALGIANGLSVSGGGNLIANAFIGLVGTNVSPFIIFAATIFICMALTQFMSNTATTAMLVPIVIVISNNLGLNPYAFAMGIIFAANISFSTPVATTPVTMTLVAGYKFNDYLKMGGSFNIIAYFLVILLIPLFFPLTL